MKITKLLFEKNYNGEYSWLPLSDIPKEFLVPENMIMIHIEHGYHDSNGWNEGDTRIQIAEEREMNQQEREELRAFIAVKKAERKKERYEQYLELKKEFEND
jgi:hypothetical protein